MVVYIFHVKSLGLLISSRVFLWVSQRHNTEYSVAARDFKLSHYFTAVKERNNDYQITFDADYFFLYYLFSYILLIFCTHPLNPSITAVLIPAALAVNRKWSAKKPICRYTQLGTGLYSGRAYKYFGYVVKSFGKKRL